MPEPSRRVRNKKRYQTKSSGGRTVIHYGSKKTNLPCCANCGKELGGLPRQEPSKISKLSGTQKRVERLYGGNLCHGCLRSLLRQAARNL